MFDRPLYLLEVMVNGNPVQKHEGPERKIYIQGIEGAPFTIGFSNDSSRRVLAVVTVDGVSVINGKSGGEDLCGYVVQAGGSVIIPGWRRSTDKVAQFEFSRLPESYAAATGRPENVGVIGCRVYLEREATLSLPSLEKGGRPGYGSNSTFRCSRQELGTSYGKEIGHRVTEVQFDSESLPCAELVIYYDSLSGLLARGIRIDPRPTAVAPNPFPKGQPFCPPPSGWQG